ncbi:MAG: hypothetical protein JW797_18320 [Bradymonadales bacterium]|nr:hypothetical protein [Bradymonadales bacterium]
MHPIRLLHALFFCCVAPAVLLAGCDSLDTTGGLSHQGGLQTAALPLVAPVPAGGPATTVEPEDHLQVVYPVEIFLPWGDGHGEIGWLPPAQERAAMAPASLAVDRDGSLWIVDQVNSRLVHLDPAGGWLGTVDCPPGGADLALGSDGRLYLLSLANHRVTVLDGGGVVDTLHIPLELVHISGLVVNERHHVLLIDAYQQTYDLGGPSIRMGWPSHLRTRREGIVTASGGPRVKAVLSQGVAELLYPEPGGDREAKPDPPADRVVLEDTDSVASIVVLDSEPTGEVVLLLEFFQGERVVRTLRRVDEVGQPLAEVVLGPPPIAFPFREFAVAAPGVILQLFPQADGLTIRSYDLGRVR